MSGVNGDGSGLRGLALFGGGTGGHLYPGIAVAERAIERFPGCRVVFFRTGRSVEESVFRSSSFETRRVAMAAPGGRLRSWLRYGFESLRLWTELGEEIAAEDFDAALGLGGYASLPGVLAARARGIPVVLLEQNATPGRVNRLLAPFVDAVSCPYAQTAARLRGRCVVTGNPVRRTVIQAAQERDRKRCKGPDARRSRAILVVGGSQGARAINRAVCDALPELEDWRGKLRWLHVAGPDDRAEVEAVYRAGGWDAAVWGYCRELPRLMAESDLVIARAGGTTLAEIAVLGLPALLVPYAHHRDGHQVLNAKLLADAGAAQLVPQSDLDPEAIRAWIARVLFDPARVEAMRAASLALAKPGAADAVLNLLLECRHPCPSLSVSSS